MRYSQWCAPGELWETEEKYQVLLVMILVPYEFVDNVYEESAEAEAIECPYILSDLANG